VQRVRFEESGKTLSEKDIQQNDSHFRSPHRLRHFALRASDQEHEQHDTPPDMQSLPGTALVLNATSRVRYE
jgi:hypothetical protein